MKVYTLSSVGIDYFFFLGNTLRKSGFDVEEVYLIDEQNYRSLAKSNGFRKLILRSEMYLIYPMQIIYKTLLAPRKSVFIVSSNTFYAPLIVKLFSFGRVKVINLIYDLFPDAIEVSGKLKPNSFLSKFIGLITKLTLKCTEGTVYLGDLLANHSNRRWLTPKLFASIDISADYSLFPSTLPVPKEFPIVFHYGGQLGHLHDAHGLISSIRAIEDYNVKKVTACNFYVSGAQTSFIESAFENFNVKVMPAVSSVQWRLDIKDFHFGLVSLTPGGATVCLPSKAYAMMGGGMAIIAICPLWSDLAKLIVDLDAGWVINNSPYDTVDQFNKDYSSAIYEKRDDNLVARDFRNLVEMIIANPSLIYEKRSNAFYGVREKYGIETLSLKWKEIINKISNS